ncbi:MAG: glucosamine-6-phosphate deaminase [Clostridia bacterium]|nr:glucosamine-6-phosphate deaminase [Clostridia bacterium]
MKTFTVDKLTVKIEKSRTAMGALAAAEISARIRALLSEREYINMIFAAAPSQNEVLASLVADKSIDWTRVNAFHMDEYIGLPKEAPQRFGNFLSEHIFSLVPFRSVNYIDSSNEAEAECRRYTALLEKYPTDIVVMGIGENGHIAFNDPGVADFNDPVAIKPAKLDDVCRMQQVHDGCFSSINEVPTHAFTLTCPTLVKATYKFCIVPAPTKAAAVAAMLRGPITDACPATLLRTVEGATLYLEPDSASSLV